MALKKKTRSGYINLLQLAGSFYSVKRNIWICFSLLQDARRATELEAVMEKQKMKVDLKLESSTLWAATSTPERVRWRTVFWWMQPLKSELLIYCCIYPTENMWQCHYYYYISSVSKWLSIFLKHLAQMYFFKCKYVLFKYWSAHFVIKLHWFFVRLIKD